MTLNREAIMALATVTNVEINAICNDDPAEQPHFERLADRATEAALAAGATRNQVARAKAQACRACYGDDPENFGCDARGPASD